MNYTLFFKRYVMTRLFDPNFIGTTNSKDMASDSMLAKFDRACSFFAQNKGCSKEEALAQALEEFTQLENLEVQAQIKEQIAQQMDAANSNEAEWVESGDKEKYPHLYLIDKLSDIMLEQMGIPKEVLYTPEKEVARPVGFPQIDGRTIYWQVLFAFNDYSLI